MDPLWYGFFIIWALVEFVQYLRKKPFRARMKTAAWWAVIFTAFAAVGQTSRSQPTWLLMGVALTVIGAIALAFYWIRVWLARLLFKAPTPS